MTQSRDNTARVWDAFTGQPLTHPFKYERGVPSSVGRADIPFSGNGQSILAALMSASSVACPWKYTLVLATPAGFSLSPREVGQAIVSIFIKNEFRAWLCPVPLQKAGGAGHGLVNAIVRTAPIMEKDDIEFFCPPSFCPSAPGWSQPAQVTPGHDAVPAVCSSWRPAEEGV